MDFSKVRSGDPTRTAAGLLVLFFAVMANFRGHSAPAPLGLREVYEAALKRGEPSRPIPDDASRRALYRSVAHAYYGVLEGETDLRHLRLLRDFTERRAKEILLKSAGPSRNREALAASEELRFLDAQTRARETQIARVRESFQRVTGLMPDRPLGDLRDGLPLALPSLSLMLACAPWQPELTREIKALHRQVSSGLSHARQIATGLSIARRRCRARSRDYSKRRVPHLAVLRALDASRRRERLLDRIHYQTLEAFASLQIATGLLPDRG